MSFEKWVEDYYSGFSDAIGIYSKYRGGLKMKDETTMLIPPGLEDKTVELYTAYRIQKTNRWLVWATWFLALSTITLSIITLFFK